MIHLPGAVRVVLPALVVLAATVSACGGDGDAVEPRAGEATATVDATARTSAYECAPPYPTPPHDHTTVFCTDPARLERATLVRVVDGDTIVVDIDGVEERVRFFGIDAPERGEDCFDEATERVEELLDDHVLLLPDVRGRDRFDRLLRYVYTPDGLSLDSVLVAEGLAEAWRRDGDLRDAIVALEEMAVRAGEGCLWAP
jgi:micrococcal nuclease